MKFKFYVLPLLLLMSACRAAVQAPEAGVEPGAAARQTTLDAAAIQKSLDELAELERAGSWLAGMGLTESGIRENAGDITGAVAAAYKELSFAYGRGLIQKADVEQGIKNLLDIKNDAEVISAATAVFAFLNEQWELSYGAFTNLYTAADEAEEPDSFINWMLLVCSLETNKEDRRAAAAYKSIRARYSQFPEYWYRGARAFSDNIAAEYAENCINTASSGPFAEECRKILAVHTGLKPEDGASIRTKKEIESIISKSINEVNPEVLDPLLSLIALPDNPYTLYTVGALRALMGVPVYKDYFYDRCNNARGRLAERLTYICRS